jgi:hypothetical protein
LLLKKYFSKKLVKQNVNCYKVKFEMNKVLLDTRKIYYK